LLTTHPCFIVSQRLRDSLEKAGFTGYHFDDVEISTTEEFEEICPGVKLPCFYWMKVDGIAGVDDVGLTAKNFLVVSDRFLNILRGFAMGHCLVRRRPFRSPGTT